MLGDAVLGEGLEVHDIGQDKGGVISLDFSGTGKLPTQYAKTMKALASGARFRIECRDDEGGLWLWLGEGGEFHDLPGTLTYEGEDEVAQGQPIPTLK